MANDLKASLAKDQERLKTLQARITAKEARVAAATRKLDTRRKVLLGSYLLDALHKAPDGLVATTFKTHLVDFRGFIGERNESAFEDFFPAA